MSERPHRLFARAIAVALRHDEAHRELVRALRASPHRENKVLLHELLRDPAAATLRERVRDVLDASPAQVMALLAQVPQIEVYVPVSAQRRRVGVRRIEQVATQISGADEVIAFTVGGQRVVLDSLVPPQAMTLALIRRESVDADYATRPPKARGTRQPVASGAGGISLRVADCDDPSDPGCAGGDNSPTPILSVPDPTTPAPGGLFVNYFEFNELREAWIKGNPEVEVWLYGTMQGIYQGSLSGGAAVLSFNGAGSRAVAVDCGGDTRVDDGLWRFFDLNTTGPIRPSRPVLFGVAPRLQFRDVTGTGGSPNVLLQERMVWLQAPYAIQVIERDDDRGGCPVPPTDRPWSIQIGYDAVSGKPIINGVSWSDIYSWITTPNDELLYRAFPTWSSLASAGWISGAYGGVTISNQGFPMSPLGSGETILYREPCVLGPFRSPSC